MSILPSTASSPAIGDTGPIPDIPRTIHLNGAAHDQPPGVRPATTERPLTSEPAGVGHNSKGAVMPKDESGKAPAWATPSKEGFDEAAAANAGPGRHRHQLEAMIEGVFDPRLGISPLPVQLLAAVIECINGKTGMAHPGGRYWAQRIVNYLSGIPAQYREGALKNAVTAVRQAGYAVSEKRAAERGGRAIAHFAITRPSPDEKQAGIEAWCREKLGLEPIAEVTRGMTTAEVTRGVTTAPCGHPGNDLSQGCGHPGTEAVVTLGVKNSTPHSITEPRSLFNPLSGADAPGAADATLFSDEAPSEGVPPPAKDTPCKPSDGTLTKRKPPAPKATEDQFNRFWAVYPIKEGKAAARKNFLALSRDDAEWAIIAAARYADKIAAERAKLARRGEEPRIKWAQGWLTERRFEDYEPANVAAPTAPDAPCVEPNWWLDPVKRKIAARHESDDWWRRLIEKYCADRWDQEFAGPPPGDPGCLVSDRTKLSDILGRFTRKKGTP